jgi:demethylmenaquinone methyltransferase/2-methoxy-6-polyprenyl-1,4-benzoquinol methylase
MPDRPSYRLPDAEQKDRYVRAKFDEIAQQYDRFNDWITQGQHRWWKRVMVRRLRIAPGQRGLDLCCGTGDIALRCLPMLRGAGGVVAADFSLNMLALAKQRLAKAPGPPTLTMCADAMRLPFAAASFDFVTIGYGLRNVKDLPGCLAEICRVLKPGGGMASLDLGKVRWRWVRPFVDAYMFHVVPWIGRRLQPGQEMFTYLPHSNTTYPHQDALKDLLSQSGFERVELIEYLFGSSVIHVAWKR